MRAMILAAGLGERMGELTRDMPKPLLKINGRYLIEYVIYHLKRAGITDIVINIHYHAEKIKKALGDGSQYGCCIQYSYEEKRLEVGGGVVQALPLLGNEPFILVSSDIICDYPLQQLQIKNHVETHLAHLILVDNPPFHPQGDFGLQHHLIDLHVSPKFNYAGIGIYKPELFSHEKPGFLSWRQIIFPAIEKKQIQGEYYQGVWFNIGTRHELELANAYFSQHPPIFL